MLDRRAPTFQIARLPLTEAEAGESSLSELRERWRRSAIREVGACVVFRLGERAGGAGGAQLPHPDAHRPPGSAPFG